MSVILCTAGYDHTIRFWEALSGLCSRQISHPDSQINRLCISPNKQYLAAAGKFSVKLFSCKSNADQNPILVFEGHTGNITGVGFHCDTKWMVTSSEDGTVKIWDTKNGTVQRNYNHGSPVNDVVIHPNQGELISCDRGGNVRIWDLSENKCSHQLIPEENTSVASVTVASDGSLLCAGNNNGNVYVWRLLQHQDATSLVPVCKFAAHNTYITRVLLSPDVRHLATCSADHTARIWTVDLSYSPPSPTDESDSSPPGSGDGPHPFVNTNISPHLQHSHSQNAPGNNFRATGHPPAPPPPHTSTNPSFITNSSNMSHRGSSSGNNAPAQSGREPNAFPLESTLMGHQRWVWDCAFSADSAYLVTACSDHYARLWDLKEQTVIRQYNGHHRGAVCVALNDYSEEDEDAQTANGNELDEYREQDEDQEQEIRQLEAINRPLHSI